MTNNSQITQHITVALMGGDHYARNGIKTLLSSIRDDLHIIIIEGGYQELDKALSSIRIDILFISGAEKYHTGYDSLKYLKKIKVTQPEVIICLYSTSAHSLLWVREDIDAYISLQNTVYQWRIKLAKMVDSHYRPQKQPAALSLTPGKEGIKGTQERTGYTLHRRTGETFLSPRERLKKLSDKETRAQE